MQVTPVSHQRLTQALQIAPAIAVIQEAGHPVIAALHDMLRYTGKIVTRKPGHAFQLQARTVASEASDQGLCCRRTPRPTDRNCL